MGCCNEILAQNDTNNLNNKEPEVIEYKNNPNEQTRNDLLVKKKSSLNKSRTNAEDFDIDTYTYEMLKLHNELREKHNSPPLSVNIELNDLAGEYAESLAEKNEKNCQFNVYNGEILGENIFISDSKKAEDVFKRILIEKRNYENDDFNKNKYNNSTGHFTQAIWKSTTEFGCGFWADKRNKKNYYIVLLYYPAGNILGKFSENVDDEIKK